MLTINGKYNTAKVFTDDIDDIINWPINSHAKFRNVY